MVRYTYDAWGKPLSCTGPLAATLGKLNPFRYRGYVLDEETGLYYLRSRYYNASWCRFINADIVIRTKGVFLISNQYTYCKNTPIQSVDMSGCAEISAVLTDRRGEETLYGTHSIEQLLPVDIFIGYLVQMVDEGWMYPEVDPEGKRYPMSYGVVDCVGIYRFCMQYHFSEDAYNYFVKSTLVEGIYKESTFSKEGQSILIRQRGKAINYDKLVPGMAVFNANISNNEFKHIAIYIGWTEEYGHTIIESNIDLKTGEVLPVRYSTLSPEAGYIWACKLKGIGYK